MLFYIVGRGMDCFAAVEGYGDEGDFDGCGDAAIGSYFDFAFYPGLRIHAVLACDSMS